jgi:hypothetical protein
MIEEPTFELWLDTDENSFWYSGTWWGLIGAALLTNDISEQGHVYTKKELKGRKND